MGTDKKIEVCHLISGDLWAGAEVQMFTLVMSLKKESALNVSAIVLNMGKLAANLGDSGIEVLVVDESQNNFFQTLSLIKKALKEKKIDILHTHRYKENILGALLKKYGIIQRLVQTVHGLGEEFHGFKLLKARLYSYLDLYFTKKYFDKILTVSSDIQNELNGRIESDRLITIHNAVNMGNLTVNKTPDEIKKELGIEENQPVIGTAGRIVPVKGYDIFLKMAEIILEKMPEVRFLLVGDGPLKNELENKARAMGLEGKVLFPGFREDIIVVLNCFDIFVISSYHEGIPMVLLEAMGLRKAIVATAVGGVKEIITNNVSGLLTESGDAPALAEACLKILNDVNVRNKLQKGAIDRVNEEFSAKIQGTRVLNLYREIMDLR